MRAEYEKLERDGTLVECHVTVQGWLRDGTNLWEPGDLVLVFSPMAMLNPMVLGIQSVIYSQDQRGTLSELELVLPQRLKAAPYGADATPDQPQPGDGAKTDSQPPAPPKPVEGYVDPLKSGMPQP